MQVVLPNKTRDVLLLVTNLLQWKTINIKNYWHQLLYLKGNSLIAETPTAPVFLWLVIKKEVTDKKETNRGYHDWLDKYFTGELSRKKSKLLFQNKLCNRKYGLHVEWLHLRSLNLPIDRMENNFEQRYIHGRENYQGRYSAKPDQEDTESQTQQTDLWRLINTTPLKNQHNVVVSCHPWKSSTTKPPTMLYKAKCEATAFQKMQRGDYTFSMKS